MSATAIATVDPARRRPGAGNGDCNLPVLHIATNSAPWLCSSVLVGYTGDGLINSAIGPQIEQFERIIAKAAGSRAGPSGEPHALLATLRHAVARLEAAVDAAMALSGADRAADAHLNACWDAVYADLVLEFPDPPEPLEKHRGPGADRLSRSGQEIWRPNLHHGIRGGRLRK